jgi:hypothetical protein
MSKSYFAKRALSNSGIKQLLKSPAHFRQYTDNPTKPTPALRMGQGFHLLVSQPHLAEKIAIFNETKTFASKSGEKFFESHGDHICLTEDELLDVQSWTKAVHNNAKIMQIIKSCTIEREIYGSQESGHGMISVKGMLDGHNDSLIFDLKTTSDLASDFPYTAKKYGYDIQAAWYQYLVENHLDGKPRDFYFIVVEKSPPYGVLIYKAGDEFLQKGAIKCNEAIELYGKSVAGNHWPAYDTDSILTL